MLLYLKSWLARQEPTVTGIDRIRPCRAGGLTALLAGVVLAGACCLPARAGDHESVWIFNAQGAPVLCTTDVYDTGHVYQLPSYTEIGTVNSEGFIISDATGQEIGLIDPSEAATEYGL